MTNLEKIEIYKKGIESQFVDEEFKEQMRVKIAELEGAGISIQKSEKQEEEVIESVELKNESSEVPLYTKLNYVLPFMQKDQRVIVKNDVQEFKDVIDSLYDIISKMPVTYGQDGVKDPIVYLHYFAGDMDWYITEKDVENKQLQAFGYANLGYGAEMGYISIEELTSMKEINLDFYFDPKKWSEISGEEIDEIEKEAKEHEETFEKIKKGEIKTATDLGESIVKEHQEAPADFQEQVKREIELLSDLLPDEEVEREIELLKDLLD